MSAKYTQEEFNKLPALLTRSVAMEWTGLGKEELTDAARSGEVRTYPQWKENPKGVAKGQKVKAGRRIHKYFKVDVARICGLKV